MQLNENYRIITDENNVILQFFEQRDKTIKNGSDDKKDWTKESFEFTDNFYYPTLKSALIAFLDKSIRKSENIEECLSEIAAVELIIRNIKL